MLQNDVAIATTQRLEAHASVAELDEAVLLGAGGAGGAEGRQDLG
jgi:hypothetical protein